MGVLLLRASSVTTILPLLVAFFILFSFFPARVEGIYAEKSFYVKSYVTVFQKFGFEVNGTFAVTHTSFDPSEASKSIFFYLCDADQWRSLYTSGDVKSFCAIKQNSSSSGMCELSHLLFNDARLTNYTVRESSLYYFVALRCFGASDNGVTDGEGSSQERKRLGHEAGADADDDRARMTWVTHITDDIDSFVDTGSYGVDTRDHEARLKNEKLSFPVDVVEMSISYTLLNPGGRHLSVGSAPLPTVYSVFVAWWSWLTLMYGLILFLKYRHRTFSLWTPPGWGSAAGASGEEQVVSLHWVLELVVATKLVVELSGMFYWRLCDHTGHCYVQISYLQSFMFALSESLLFAVLLLVAKGWKITRWKLPLSEVRSITVALLLLLSTLLFFSLYNESYYFFSILIMYIFMLPKIFSAVTKNLKRLGVQLAFVTRLHDERARLGQRLPPHVPRPSTLNAKLRLFQFLKATVGMYMGSFVLLSLLKMVMPWRLNWVNNFLQEISSVLVIGAIIYLLAPNPKLFSRSNMFDEESLPWLHRNILQRLLESGEDGAEGLLFLVHGDRRGDGSFFSDSGNGSAKVDFGDGNVSDLSDLVVFEFPRDQPMTSSPVAMVDGEGKGKTLANDDHVDTNLQNGGGGASTTLGLAASARYLAIGAVEQFVDREAANRKAQEEEEAKAKAKAARKEMKRNAQRMREETTAALRPPHSNDRGGADEAGQRQEQNNWQRRRWLLLHGRDRREDQGGEESEGEREDEIELVIMRRSGRPRDGADDDDDQAVGGGGGGGVEQGTTPRLEEEEEEEEEEVSEHSRLTTASSSLKDDEDDEEGDLEKGTEMRALLPPSSSSSS